jgi:hypothetical protein
VGEAVKDQGQMPAEQGGREETPPIPDHFQMYLDILKQGVRAHSEQTEREAYAEMQSQIDREEDREIRQFMQDTLEYYCQDCSMLLSYIWGTYWHQWIKEQRALQSEAQPIELLIALESILANQCDSSGYTKTYGQRRSELTIPGNYPGTAPMETRNVDTNVPRARFLNSYYKIGVHKFRVGHAIKNILDHVEERYGLDFKELERIHQRAGKKP